MPRATIAACALALLGSSLALAQQGVMITPLDRSSHLSSSKNPGADQKGGPTFGERLDSLPANTAAVGLGVAGAVVPGSGVLNNALGSALGGGENIGSTGMPGKDMIENMRFRNMSFSSPTKKQPALLQGVTPVRGPATSGPRIAPTTR